MTPPRSYSNYGTNAHTNTNIDTSITTSYDDVNVRGVDSSSNKNINNCNSNNSNSCNSHGNSNNYHNSNSNKSRISKAKSHPSRSIELPLSPLSPLSSSSSSSPLLQQHQGGLQNRNINTNTNTNTNTNNNNSTNNINSNSTSNSTSNRHHPRRDHRPRNSRILNRLRLRSGTNSNSSSGSGSSRSSNPATNGKSNMNPNEKGETGIHFQTSNGIDIDRSSSSSSNNNNNNTDDSNSNINNNINNYDNDTTSMNMNGKLRNTKTGKTAKTLLLSELSPSPKKSKGLKRFMKRRNNSNSTSTSNSSNNKGSTTTTTATKSINSNSKKQNEGVDYVERSGAVKIQITPLGKNNRNNNGNGNSSGNSNSNIIKSNSSRNISSSSSISNNRNGGIENGNDHQNQNQNEGHDRIISREMNDSPIMNRNGSKNSNGNGNGKNNQRRKSTSTISNSSNSGSSSRINSSSSNSTSSSSQKHSISMPKKKRKSLDGVIQDDNNDNHEEMSNMRFVENDHDRAGSASSSGEKLIKIDDHDRHRHSNYYHHPFHHMNQEKDARDGHGGEKSSVNNANNDGCEKGYEYEYEYDHNGAGSDIAVSSHYSIGGGGGKKEEDDLDIDKDDDDDDDNDRGSLLKRFRNTNYRRDECGAPFDTIEISKKDLHIESSEESLLSSPSFSTTTANSDLDGSFYFDEGENDDNKDDDDDYDNGISLDSYEDDDEDDIDNSESSCASTVVNDKPPRLVRPPPTATKEEQAKFYWELCYGKEAVPKATTQTKSWSASRKPPVKSCLSAKKTPWTEIAQSSSKRSVRRGNNLMNMNKQQHQQKSTPTVCDQFKFHQDDDTSLHHPSPTDRIVDNSSGNHATLQHHDTPMIKTPQSHDVSEIKSVKFGNASAAEFESSRPTVELTPLPSDKVREQFPLDEKDVSSDDESTELHHETARNGDRLALWEDSFDDFITNEWDDNEMDVDDDSDDEGRGFTKQKRMAGSRPSRQNERRSSVFFSRGGGGLVDFNSAKEKKRHSKDNETSTERNRMQMNEEESKFSPISRNSMQFSSPSVASSFRLSTSESETSKITPKADLNSSSSLLRSVHSSGGASIGRNVDAGHDEGTQELKPNQLDITLRKAEGSSHHVEKRPTNNSLIDKIVSETESLASDPDAVSKYHFGTLLKERSHNNGLPHNIEVSMWLNSIFNTMTMHSHVSISEAACQTFQSNVSRHENIGQCDVAEGINMSVLYLEQELLRLKDCTAEEMVVMTKFLYQLTMSEKEDLYSSLVEVVFSEWEQLETQTLQRVSSYFELLLQETNQEEEEIIQLAAESKRIESIDHFRKTRTRKFGKHEQIMEELKAIEELESRISTEEQELKHFHELSSLWYAKMDVEMHFPFVAIDYTLLKMILTFDEKLLMTDRVDISYSHLDERSSETQISWNGEGAHGRHKPRHSLSSLDSSLSSEGIIDLLTRTPSIKRVKNTKKNEYFKNDEYLPLGSAAHKLYTTILNGCEMNAFVSHCFRQEQEAGILTVTDVFQRLNLMALDVMELHKYYSCRVERPPKSSCIMLHVTIALGGALSIGIRFTYDLSSQRTFLCSIPSDVFIYPITGEPAVPINMLLRVAQCTIFTEPISNAFLLKRTCSNVVDTLQGR